MRYILPALISLALPGCVAGPDYARPDIPAAPTYRVAGGTEPIVSSWWLVYNDQALNRLQEEALQNNFTIEAALARVDQSRSAIRRQIADTRPVIDTQGSIGRAVQSQNYGVGLLSRIIPDYPRTITDLSAGVGSTWDIDFAGSNQRRNEIARAGLAQSAWGVAAARLAVSADLADAYWGLRAAEMRQSQLNRLIEIASRQHEIMEGRAWLGAASDQNLADSLTMLSQLRASQPAIDASVERYKSALFALLGKPSSDDLHIANKSSALPDMPNPAIGLPADLVSRRPDVSSAEQQLIAANAGIGLAISEYYPKLSLSALLGIQSARSGDVFSTDSIAAFGGAGLRWRLFDFGRIDAEVGAAKGRTREAVAAYRQTVLSASIEVEQCFFTLNAAREEMIRQKVAVESATLRTEIEQKAYVLGGRSLDDLLTHQRKLAELDIELLASHEEALRASVACYRALGIVP